MSTCIHDYDEHGVCLYCDAPRAEPRAEAPPALAGEGAELIATIVYRDGQITYVWKAGYDAANRDAGHPTLTELRQQLAAAIAERDAAIEDTKDYLQMAQEKDAAIHRAEYQQINAEMWHTNWQQTNALLEQARADLAQARTERDEAVQWIGVVCTELVDAGGQRGDRTVGLANLRAALTQLAQARSALEARTDVPGMNTESEQLAVSFAVQACPAFTPSQHANAYRRSTGANAACIQCGKPQHQHWLRQALRSQEQLAQARSALEAARREAHDPCLIYTNPERGQTCMEANDDRAMWCRRCLRNAWQSQPSPQGETTEAP